MRLDTTGEKYQKWETANGCLSQEYFQVLDRPRDGRAARKPNDTQVVLFDVMLVQDSWKSITRNYSKNSLLWISFHLKHVPLLNKAEPKIREFYVQGYYLVGINGLLAETGGRHVNTVGRRGGVAPL